MTDRNKRNAGSSTPTRRTTSPRSTHARADEIQQRVDTEVDRLLGKRKEPDLEAVPWTWTAPNPAPNPPAPLVKFGICPVCKCPDYRWLPIEDRRPEFVLRMLGVIIEPPTPKPTHEWVCAHCRADRDFLSGPVMWGELLELRESVVVDNLSYEDFCKKELELFERYMSPEDIELSDQMANLSAAASFTVEYDGQHRSLRTGLLIRRFQILQILRRTTPADHRRWRGLFGHFRGEPASATIPRPAFTRFTTMKYRQSGG